MNITTVGERGKDAVVMEIAEPFHDCFVARIVEQDDSRIERGVFFRTLPGEGVVRSLAAPTWEPDPVYLGLRGVSRSEDPRPFHIGTAADRDRFVEVAHQLNRSLRRKRKVQVERWGHFYSDGSFNTTCPNRESVEHYVNRIGGSVVRLTGEYEVDE
jgi:hypothetical protein